ncbi:ExbD/TolR family protein [Pseudoalteromonas piscicida]|uniref:Biopolymer transporter ExbD n=1 Tax=Pseudoalteromonas piscicida TaxID=43662 RepID=A0A2A5JW58_PSEO7|nr:biopolymer transporter ExbD [Pseudoalteromonas piscicida]PCK33702.1 biopolymer transporter ExbD [Pseudoalteromonas piscicida]
MAFGQGFEDDDEVMAEINMTPLVDVMLVLLIIFIITMPVITQSIEVELPKAAQQETSSEVVPDSIDVIVQANGDIQWQHQSVTLAQLEQKLAEVAMQSPQPPIQLQGAAKVPYENVVKVMAMAQKSGVNSLNFVTQTE